MNFGTKLVISLFTIATTVVASIYGGFVALDTRMETKVKDGEARVLGIMAKMKDARDTEIKGIDNKYIVQFEAINVQLSDIKKDVRAILIMGKKRANIEEKSNYTYQETNTGEEAL